jgi:hypothetical protein
VLEFTSVDETVLHAFFAIWGIGSIIFFAIAGTVRGTTRVNIAAARRKPRMKAIRESVLQAAFWIIAMTAFQHYQEPDRKLTSILLQWGLGGIIYGVMMYLYTYGWRRRKV